MKPEKKIFLSIIIPTFNEEQRIKKIHEIVNYLKTQEYLWEIIVVDDGSQDNTLKKLKKLQKELHYKLISYPVNYGKGYAVKTGMLAARGKYRLFIDIDLSTPIAELANFLPYLKKFNIVIGSRKMKSANVMIRQPFLREFLGKVFTLISQKVLGMNISDFTCGFKCFSDKTAIEIFSRQKNNRWGFDAEILYIAKMRHNQIKEIPVNWSDDPRTKVKFPQDIINSLKELIKIRINAYAGFYK